MSDYARFNNTESDVVKEAEAKRQQKDPKKQVTGMTSTASAGLFGPRRDESKAAPISLFQPPKVTAGDAAVKATTGDAATKPNAFIFGDPLKKAGGGNLGANAAPAAAPALVPTNFGAGNSMFPGTAPNSIQQFRPNSNANNRNRYMNVDISKLVRLNNLNQPEPVDLLNLDIAKGPLFLEDYYYHFIDHAHKKIKKFKEDEDEDKDKEENRDTYRDKDTGKTGDKGDVKEIKNLKGRADSLLTKIKVMQTKTEEYKNSCEAFAKDVKLCHTAGKRLILETRKSGRSDSKPFLDFFENEITEIERKILDCNRRVQFLNDQLGHSQSADSFSSMDDSMQSHHQTSSSFRNAGNPDDQDELQHMVEVEKEAFKNLSLIIDDINENTEQLKRNFLQCWKSIGKGSDPPVFNDEAKEKKKKAKERAEFHQRYQKEVEVKKTPNNVSTTNNTFGANTTSFSGFGNGASSFGKSAQSIAPAFQVGALATGGGTSNPFNVGGAAAVNPFAGKTGAAPAVNPFAKGPVQTNSFLGASSQAPAWNLQKPTGAFPPNTVFSKRN